jgi:hypothetical protein
MAQPPSPEGFRLRRNYGVTSWRAKRQDNPEAKNKKKA